MTQSGYSLVNTSNGTEIEQYGNLPNILSLPNGNQVHCPALGASYSGLRLVTRFLNNNPPSQWHVSGGSTLAYDAVNANLTETVTFVLVPLATRQTAMCAQVDRARDTQAAAGITLNGKLYQTDSDSRENIAGGAQLAVLAIAGGALPGNTKWDGSGSDFGWITADNSIVLLDAQTMLTLAKAAAEFKKNCIMYGYGMKQQINAATAHTTLDAINVTAGWPTA
jgi:hypothetical protein